MKCFLQLLLLFIFLHFHEAQSERIGAYTFVQFKDTTTEEYRPGYVKFIAAADSGKKIIAVSAAGNRNFYYYRSEDYGTSWEMFFKDTLYMDGMKNILPRQVKCIEFPSEDYCVIGLDSGKLRVTEDFGQTWRLVETGYNYDIDELVMLDDLYGVAMLGQSVTDSMGVFVRQNIKMLKTTDGWQSWNEIELPNDIIGIRRKTLFILGRENIGFYQAIDNDSLVGIFVFTSNNGGDSWQWSKSPNNLGGICFRTSNEIYAVTAKLARFDSVWYNHRYFPVFMKSNNNGISWDTLLVRNDTIFGAGRLLEFLDENNGIVILNPFKRYLTNDAGRSWYYQDDYQTEMQRKYSGLSDYDLINENFIVYAATSSIVIYDNRNTSVQEFEEKDFTIYPNPASAFTNISYSLSTSGSVNISLRDVLGRKVKTIFDGYQSEGSHTEYVGLVGLPPGVYFIVLTAGSHRRTIKFSVGR